MLTFDRWPRAGLFVLLAAGAARAQDLTVYDDALQNGFQDYSYGGGSDFSSPAQAHGGTKSIAFTGDNFNAVSFAHPAQALTTDPVPDAPLLGSRGGRGRTEAASLRSTGRLRRPERPPGHLHRRRRDRRGSLAGGHGSVRVGSAVVFGVLRPDRPPERRRGHAARPLHRRRDADGGRRAAGADPRDRARRDGRLDAERPLHVERRGGPATRGGPRAQRRRCRARRVPRRGAARVPLPDAGRDDARRGRHDLRQRGLRGIRIRRLPPRRRHRRHRRGRLAPRLRVPGDVPARLRGTPSRDLPVHAVLPALLLDDGGLSPTPSTRCR